MDGGHIQNGLYYAIICKAGDQSLRSEKTDPEHCDGSKIMNWNPNPNDDLQVWLFDQIEPGQFEIVHCKSGLVMDEEKKEVKLKVGKQKKDQLFEVVPYTGQAFHKYYYLKTGEKKDQSLYLDGILRIAPLQEGNDQFLFRLEPVNNHNQTIQKSVVIRNHLSGMALDIPGGSHKKGTELIVWPCNYRWNQRWFHEGHGKGHSFRSIMTGQCIDIAGENKKPGGKIIQWEGTGGNNQQWCVEKSNIGFKLRSCM